MAEMKEKYGEEKGEQVFYAAKNKGTITGVDTVSSVRRVYLKRSIVRIYS